MRNMLLPLAVLVVSTSVSTSALARSSDRERDAAVDYAEREGCILPQVIAPSFNNTAVAIEQSRIAAVSMRRAANRNGDTMSPICGSEHDPRDLPGEKTMGEPAPVSDEGNGWNDAASTPEEQPDAPPAQ